MKKICFLLFSTLCIIFLFSFTMVNANEINFDIDYNECNTFEYIGDAKNEPHYDLDKRNNEIVGNDVLLTVLTHGLGGDASHWSKASDEAQTDSDSKDLFGYEKDSLVDKLCDALEYKANVLYYSIKRDMIEFKDKTAEFGCEGEDNYHTIMVFETEQTFDSNEYVYSQFDYAVSKAVYDIKLKYGKLPKINLIGHSRGGLINLLYAMDHPFMVNQIFSMGTPYVGSSTAELDIKYNLGIGIGETDKGGDEGERDIIDSTLYNSYMNRWNNNYDRYYNHIDVTAMGAKTSIKYLCKLLSDKNLINYINKMDDNSGIASQLKELKDYLNFRFKNKIIGLIGPAIDGFLGATGFLPKDVEKIIEKEVFLDDAIYDEVWNNDFLVNLRSALGVGYRSFDRFFKLYINYDTNAPCADKSMPAVPHNLLTKDSAFINEVVTNIEMNGKTSSKYLYTVMQNGYIRIDSYIGHETDVVVPYRIDDKKVLEINRNAFNGLLLCDENGEIINNTNAINSITISSFVNTVNKTAFANCSSLEKISFVDYGENEEYDEYDVIKSSILDLDYKEMFENLNNLKEINIDSHYFTSVDGILYTKDKKTLLKYPAVTDKYYFKVPDTVTSIGDSAFKNSNISQVDLNNTIKLGSNVFENTNYLMNVVANKISSVGDDSFKNSRWLREQINSSLGIISLGNVVLGYNPGYNKNVDISYEDLKDYTCVANGAFNGLDSLKISIPRNIKTIASAAFNNIGGLEIFVQNTYNNISSIANNVDNLEINVLRELDDFYKNRISTYNLFEGNIGNSSYKISELNDFDNSLILFILNQDYREYSDNEIKINEIVFRDKSTLLPAYKVKDLYLDSDYQIKYTDSTIRLDNNQCFYIKMEPIRYTVFIDYDNGDDGDESEKSMIFYNYNEMVRFNLASKPYCQPLSRFRLNGEIVYANNATKIENLFDAECDCFNPVVELTAIWDYEVYTITYHEKDINDKEKNIHKHIHISKC